MGSNCPGLRKVWYDHLILPYYYLVRLVKEKNNHFFWQTWILPENKVFFSLSLIFLSCKQSIHAWEKDLCVKVGSVPWSKSLEEVQYMLLYVWVVQWDNKVCEKTHSRTLSRVLDRDKWNFMCTYFWSWC